MLKQQSIQCLMGLIFMWSACVPYNHISSPEVLPEDEHSLELGLNVEPGLFSYDTLAYAFSPVIGYRTGLGHGADFGVSIYGPLMPCIVLDYKHYIVNAPRQDLSGDLIFFAGYQRPTGLQYNFLFGSPRLYGLAGLNYFFTDQLKASYNPNWVLGLGVSNKGDESFTLQLGFSQTLRIQDKDELYNDKVFYNQPYLSIGLKWNLKFIKSAK